MNSKLMRATDFDDFLAEELKDEEFRRYYDEAGKQLELAYGILQLRKARKMSQAELAKRVGTTQSNIARIEGGNENLTVLSLTRIAAALGKELEIKMK